MVKISTPKTEQALAELITQAPAPLAIAGMGTKHELGNPVAASAALSLSGFSGIEIYEPEELILEAGAGTELAMIEELLAKHRQMLAFEPPDYSQLLSAKSRGTLGGLVACGLSGPRRIKAGSARDHVLGARGVTGRGDVFKAGARVVKNVTGYDIPKLLTGSYGTLAALTAVTVKVLPKPETEETIAVTGLDDQAAGRIMSIAMQSSADVSGAAHVPGKGTYLRLEGISPSVQFRRDRLREVLPANSEVLPADESAMIWRGIRDGEPLPNDKDRAIWRISAAPTESPAIVQKISAKLDALHYLDWAGGLIWLAVANSHDGGAAIVRSSVENGHATLFRAPPAIRTAVNAFHPQQAALAGLTARLKSAFDPRGILNPGRMYRGV